LEVNNNYYLSAFKFDKETIEKHPFIGEWKSIYGLPYRFFKPKKVLIVGCGGANDLVLALENNAENIDCVEIDPKIVEFARVLRKDHPYDNPKVNLFIDDARSFIKSTNKKYDLIVYGFLDSQRLFSTMANVRLDNFVYTVEGIKEAKEHLREGGAIALSFYAAKPWVAQKLYGILAENFSQKPWVFSNNEMPWEKVFIATDNTIKLEAAKAVGFTEESDELQLNSHSYKLPEDDWPYLYMKNNFVPIDYLAILSLILVLSVFVVRFSIKQFENVIQNIHFFLLGAAFMLLETKSIIEFSLLFGSSWLVNSIVITAILLMILFANLYLIKFNPKKINFFYLLLFLSLLFLYFFPPKTFVSFASSAKLFLSSFVVALPILFAAMVFGLLFKRSKKTSTALGLNLIGVVLGGFLEYSSLVFGINNLIILGFALYLLSYLFVKKYVAF
jgi:SAM-dependent methyltransferase